MAAGRPPGHAFISYVREDAPRADRLQRALEAAGVDVWRDTRDLWPGQDWKIEIRRAISDDSLVFIACFSEVSEQRHVSYQYEELNQAVEQMRLRRPGRPWIIPVRFAECALPAFDLGAGNNLDSLQRVDLFDDNWDEGIAKLVRVVIHALESDDSPTLLTRRRLLSAAATTALVYIASTSAGGERQDIAARGGSASHTVEIGNARQWETGHWGPSGISAIDFTPDGTLIATGGNEILESTTRLWDAVSHERVQILTGGAAPIAFSPDGQYLATWTADFQIRFWDVSTFGSSSLLPTSNLSCLEFIPGTDSVVGGNGDGKLQTWDATTATELRATRAPHSIDSLIFDGEQHMLTSGVHLDVTGKFSVVVWDATSAKELHELPGMSGPTALSPDGSVLIAAGSLDAESAAHNLEAWDLVDGKRIAVLLESEFSVYGTIIVFRPDGRLLAVGSDSELQLWNVRRSPTGVIVDRAADALRLDADGSRITSIAFGPDGMTLAAGDHQAVLRLWQLRSLSDD